MPQRAIKYAVVDAFTEEAFKGNPAAVCLLEENADVDEKWMLSVAKEFNAPMTAFLSPLCSDAHDIESSGDGAPQFRIWWFTPTVEVDLCGHATLAATHFLLTSDLAKHDIVKFVAKIGIVTAKRVPKSDSILKETHEKFFVELDFPVVPMMGGDALEPSLPKTLKGASVVNVQKTSADDLLVELSSGKEVAMLEPDFEEIKKCDGRRVIVTGAAPDGSEYDFFTRVFCPKFGLDEDSVCGSAHCALVPYWSKRLNRQTFTAFMASPRTGVLYVELEEKSQRVRIRGEAVTVMLGTLLV
ncbi:Phenazine biosynthesis-like domain-containing protein [Rhynchospora pubera]|uniref:Phenazine biosynthesis-like domain-containing protein n=1 Tax=Rhynchospora pubera TaxID=906938 RepID=A0AAV8F8R7_9POAL|nr:Phenazine biosynthesis-like domain-containing protein [Rhynchospora pubera]